MDIGVLLLIAIIAGIIFGLIGVAIANNKGVGKGLGFLLGALLGPIGLIITALLSPSPSGPQPEPKRPKEVFTEPADLADADYRVWLTEEYSITKNEVLGQFYCAKRLFDTADEAVAHAHELETQKRNAEKQRQDAEKARLEKIERERQAQQEQAEQLRLERQKRNRPYVMAGWSFVLAATGFGIYTLYAMEQARIEAIPQTIEDQGYALFSDQIRSRDGVYRVIGTDVPFTGIARAFYKNGQIREETNLTNGKRDGQRRTWRHDGTPDYEGNWVAGVEQDSLIRSWRRNGQLFSETMYVEGEKRTYRYFRTNGQLSSETDYVNGQKHGLERSWHKNGQLWSETNYVSDRKHGLKRTWKDNGKEYNFSPECYRDDVEVPDWRGGACA